MIKKLLVILASLSTMIAGITAIPHEVVLEDVYLGNRGIEKVEKGWNFEKKAVIGNVKIRDSWLLGSEVLDSSITKYNYILSEGWRNYLADTGWNGIDTTPVKTQFGFEIKKAPFWTLMPPKSDGIMTMINNNKWDRFQAKEDTRSSLEFFLRPLGVASSVGVIETGDIVTPSGLHKNQSWVAYKNVFPNVDLIYYVHHGLGVELLTLYRFNAPPTTTSFSFELGYFPKPDLFKKSGDKIIQWDEVAPLNVEGGEAVIARIGRALSFRPARIWDSNVERVRGNLNTKIQEIPLKIEKSGIKYILTKTIPLDFFNGVIYPVYLDPTATFNPDADPETNSVDGWAERISTNSTWANIRSGAGTGANDAQANPAAPYINSAPSNLFDQLRRLFTTFDTSSITDTDTIDNCDLQINVNGKDTTIAVSYVAVSTKVGAITSIAAADYEGNLAPTSISNSTTTGANISTTGYNKWDCNSYGVSRVSLTATTTFGIQFAEDVTNTDPGSSGNFETYILPQLAETAGTASDPLLTVTSSAVAVIPPLQDDGQWFMILSWLKNQLLGIALAKWKI